MSTSRPLVSAVVPFYNQGAFVREAVEALLRQTWPELEIVIVDDGSRAEESAALLEFSSNPRIRVLRQENSGVSAARNNGITAARGKYILTLDADDTCEPTFAEKAVALLEADASLGLVNAMTRHFGDRKGPAGRRECTTENILRGRCHTALSMFRKADWAATPGYDPKLKVSEDFDFWLSLLELGRRFQRIEETLYHYRRHGDSAQSRFKRLYGSIFGGENAGVKRYVLKKHERLYALHPEAAADILRQKSDPPRFAAFKRRKYRLILLLSGLPGLRGLLGRSAAKARYRLDFMEAADMYARREKQDA
ncbi:MAG: glycosyltransferase family 2 protein [Deltaproteobacteria bacterium]|nr:glycosyltransferase family 2 protein [Deltaproteobacteria bacterium]